MHRANGGTHTQCSPGMVNWWNNGKFCLLLGLVPATPITTTWTPAYLGSHRFEIMNNLTPIYIYNKLQIAALYCPKQAYIYWHMHIDLQCSVLLRLFKGPISMGVFVSLFVCFNFSFFWADVWKCLL